MNVGVTGVTTVLFVEFVELDCKNLKVVFPTGTNSNVAEFAAHDLNGKNWNPGNGDLLFPLTTNPSLV